MYSIDEAKGIIRRILGASQADILPDISHIMVVGPTKTEQIRVYGNNLVLAYRRLLMVIEEIQTDYHFTRGASPNAYWYCANITPPENGVNGSKILKINFDVMTTGLWKKTNDNSELIEIKRCQEGGKSEE